MEASNRTPEKTGTEPNVDIAEDVSRSSTGEHQIHQNTEEKAPPANGSILRPISQLPLTWLGALITVVLFLLTVYYAMTATLGRGAAWLQTSQSRALLLLRVLSEATSIFLTLLIASSLERLQWMLISRKKGLNLPTLFSLEAGTGVLGLLQLLVLKGFGLWTRSSSLMRLSFKLVVPVLAVLIMSITSYMS